ncbi:alkyl sulfatase dimerization domain-containing protein [Vibrio sp. WXL103]|uniref:alkyl sulfatase dimerization domain-containing protein n=1 Tax=unclassified Vibrio TaxID=2614977 RepID=UPI003EC54AD4
MKKNILALAISALSFGVSAGVDYTHYNGSPTPAGSPVTLPNGIVANIEDVTGFFEIGKVSEQLRHEEVIPGVYQMFGPFYAPVVMELEEGLIVWNTGESAADGTAFRDYIREHISTKPVIAVTYDHSHYQYGTRTLLDGDEAIIIGHEIANELEATKGEGAIAATPIPELLNTLNARAKNQFGINISAEHNPADMSPTGMEHVIKESAFMEVTHPLGHGDSITVGGLEIIGYHAITDAVDTVTYYIPEYDMVIDNVVMASQNSYTLRGDQYRSPTQWIGDLKLIRDLEPEILMTSGAGSKPMHGKEQIRTTIEAVMDSMQFTYDQAIRHTNNGVRPDQLKHVIKAPQSLKEHPYVNNMYGQREHFYEATPAINAGWFSGYAEDMHNLPNNVLAANMISLIGEDGLKEEYKRAYAAGEFLWAKELAVLMYHNDPADEVARQNLASTFRELGRLSPGIIARNMYMSAAQSLEGNQAVTMTEVQSAEWASNDVATAVDYMRVRIVPEKASGVSGFFVLDIDGEQYGYDIRNGVAEYVPDVASNYRPANETLKLTSAQFGQYYAGELKASEIAADDSMLHLFEEFAVRPMY